MKRLIFFQYASFHTDELNPLQEILSQLVREREKELRWGQETVQKKKELGHESITLPQRREELEIFQSPRVPTCGEVFSSR
jgi:hypothetical protein